MAKKSALEEVFGSVGNKVSNFANNVRNSFSNTFKKDYENFAKPVQRTPIQFSSNTANATRNILASTPRQQPRVASPVLRLGQGLNSAADTINRFSPAAIVGKGVGNLLVNKVINPGTDAVKWAVKNPDAFSAKAQGFAETAGPAGWVGNKVGNLASDGLARLGVKQFQNPSRNLKITPQVLQAYKEGQSLGRQGTGLAIQTGIQLGTGGLSTPVASTVANQLTAFGPKAAIAYAKAVGFPAIAKNLGAFTLKNVAADTVKNLYLQASGEQKLNPAEFAHKVGVESIVNVLSIGGLNALGGAFTGANIFQSIPIIGTLQKGMRSKLVQDWRQKTFEPNMARILGGYTPGQPINNPAFVRYVQSLGMTLRSLKPNDLSGATRLLRELPPAPPSYIAGMIGAGEAEAGSALSTIAQNAVGQTAKQAVTPALLQGGVSSAIAPTQQIAGQVLGNTAVANTISPQSVSQVQPPQAIQNVIEGEIVSPQTVAQSITKEMPRIMSIANTSPAYGDFVAELSNASPELLDEIEVMQSSGKTLREVFNEAKSISPDAPQPIQIGETELPAEHPASLIAQDMKQALAQEADANAGSSIIEAGATETTPDVPEVNGVPVQGAVRSLFTDEELDYITGGRSKELVSGNLEHSKDYDALVSTINNNGEIGSAKDLKEGFVNFARNLGDAEEYKNLVAQTAQELGISEQVAEGNLALGFSEYLRGSNPFGGLANDFYQGVAEKVRHMQSLEATAEMINAQPDVPEEAFNPQQYVQEMVQAQEEARVEGTPDLTTLGKARDFVSKLKTELVDAFSPIEDTLTASEKMNQFSILPKNDVRLQIDRALRAPTLAGVFAKENGLIDIIKEVPDADAFGQYLIAKQALTVGGNGIETGRDLEKDKALIRALSEEYEPFAAKMRDYRKALSEYMVSHDLVDPEVMAMLEERYPDYAPLNRIFSEVEKQQASGQKNVNSIASLAKQTVIQALKGSERVVENPLASYLAMTQKMVEQGERNAAAKMLASYKDLPNNPFDITPLRTKENVDARIDIYSDLAELKPIKDKLERMLKSRSKELRSLETELNNLQKKGLNLSLKPQKDGTYTVDMTAQTKEKASWYRPEIETDEGDSFLGPATVDNVEYSLIPSEMGVRDPKRLINNLIQMDPKGLKTLRSKIENREKWVDDLFNEVDTMRTELASVKDARSQLFDEARLRKDAESRGKSTISVLNQGTKEIYEISSEVERAAKAMDTQATGMAIAILQNFTRSLQLGATGLHVPFILGNLAKDQVTALINSDMPLATSIANPMNFLKATYSAVKHDEAYQELVRMAAGGTSFDITRNQERLDLGKIRAGRGIKDRVSYIAGNPTDSMEGLLRSLENTIARGEELTRVQQYIGTRDALIKQGRTREDAMLLAAKAARNNTANFARGGNFARVVNKLIPFFNAGIQGTRSLVRSAQENPKGWGTRLAIGLFAPMTAVTLWNLSDPKRAEIYRDIQDYEKESNMILITDQAHQDDKGVWHGVHKIGLPGGYSNLASIVRRGIEGAHGLDPLKWNEVASNLFTATTSLDVGNGYLGLANKFVPQAGKPLVERGLNKDLFTGADITPDYMKSLPTEEQVHPYTSGTARLVQKLPGNRSVSPIQVEHDAASILGGLGKTLLNASDTVLNKMGMIPEEQIGGESIPENFVKRFAAAKGGQIASDLYEAKDKSAGEKTLKNKTIAELIASEPPDTTGTTIGMGIKDLTQGMTSKEIGSTLDSAYEKKIKAAMSPTEKAIASYSVAQRDDLVRKDPSMAPAVEKVTQLEAYAKLQSDIARANITSSTGTLPPGLSKEASQKLQRTNDFKYLSDLQQKTLESGLPDSLLAEEYDRLGITRDDLLYDYKTNLVEDVKMDEIRSMIDGMQGDDLINTLAGMRKVSEGSRKALLTDTIINKFVKEDLIPEALGDKLKRLDYDLSKKEFTMSDAGEGKKPKKLSVKAPSTPKAPALKLGGKKTTFKPLKTSNNIVRAKIKAAPKPKSGGVPPTKLGKKVSAQLRAPITNIRSLGNV